MFEASSAIFCAQVKTPQNHHTFCQENLSSFATQKQVPRVWSWFLNVVSMFLLFFTGVIAFGYLHHQTMWVHFTLSFLRVGNARGCFKRVVKSISFTGNMQQLWLPDLVRFSFDDAPKIEFDSTEPKDAAHLLSEVRRHLLAEMLLVSGSMGRWYDWIFWDLWCDVWGRKARQWFWMKHFHDNFMCWSGSSLSSMCVSICLTVSFLLNIY